jgi:hypothetical protein
MSDDAIEVPDPRGTSEPALDDELALGYEAADPALLAQLWGEATPPEVRA